MKTKLLLIFVLGLICCSIKGTTRSIPLTDLPVLLPPFYSIGLRNQLTGKLILELHFREGRVEAVKRLASTLVFGEEDEYSPVLIEMFVGQIEAVVEKWESAIVGPSLHRLEIEFKIDSALQSDERQYSINYDRYGVVEQIIITGPPNEATPATAGEG